MTAFLPSLGTLSSQSRSGTFSFEEDSLRSQLSYLRPFSIGCSLRSFSEGIFW